MSEYKCIPLGDNVEEMFIGPFGSSLKNECFVDEDEAYCMVYEQKHAIQKTMDVETRYVNEQKYNELKRFNVRGGDIIVSCRGTIGETFIVPDDAPFGIMHPSIMKIRLKEGVYDRYYFNLLLKSRLKKHEAEANGSGIKMAISATELGKELFPVPTMEEQLEITDIISRISSVIEKRKQELSALDDLIKARFVELFGDPNDTKRVSDNRHKIGELCDVTKLAGFEFTEYITYQDSGEIIMLRGLNCKQGKLILDNVKYIDRETSHKLPRSRLYVGDILMTYAGTIGDVAMVDEDDKYHLAPNVAKISIVDKEKVNPTFLVHLFMYSHDYIMTFASQVAQASINMQKIRDFEYIIPSMEQQLEFELFAKQVDKSKVAVQKALDVTQLLFDSLMQKYFG